MCDSRLLTNHRERAREETMLKLKGALYLQQLAECLDVTGASAMNGPRPKRLRLRVALSTTVFDLKGVFVFLLLLLEHVRLFLI